MRRNGNDGVMGRIIKKITGKTEWYAKKKKEESETEYKERRRKIKEKKHMRPTAILMITRTNEGELVGQIR